MVSTGPTDGGGSTDRAGSRTIRTVLVANRGEIALRVMRACREVGLRSVALHTDLDADAPHVHAADDVVEVGSYLDADAVVAAALACGADAIHPGYGFLSERAAFARAVEEAGLVLVGPSAAVMERMGRKDAAREVAVAAGVPVVPAYDVDADPAGFEMPVLVKAAAGGGGKGMRVVRTPGEYAEALAAARREAQASFGDDTMLVEKYVESGRHVEVQVLGDAHGRALHFFERDCSTQRRHQKVLEEAPAPTLDDQQRAQVTAAAVALADAVGYVNAGTVEFLLDNATGRSYFLEMNTRLQVEHPVTELAVSVAGRPLDLVALQLRVAAGEELGIDQGDVTLTGHAIEARVYAEDSFAGFLPQAGTATVVHWPTETVRASSVRAATGVRVDHALESGQEVSTAYDPMLGKVIAAGPDRESARRALLGALDDTAILGLTTNAGFLRALVATPEFRDATIDTAWLDTAELPAPGPDLARVVAAWTQAALASTGGAGGPGGPLRADGFRLSGAAAPVRVELDEVVHVHRDGRTRTGRVGDVVVRELSFVDGVAVLVVDGRRVRAVVDVGRHVTEVVHEGQRFVFERPDVLAAHGPAPGAGSLTAPMPGTVLAVDVTVGDRVTEGQRLGVIEAMKMELALKAPFDGTIAQVGADVGGRVALGALLFEVEADDD